MATDERCRRDTDYPCSAKPCRVMKPAPRSSCCENVATVHRRASISEQAAPKSATIVACPLECVVTSETLSLLKTVSCRERLKNFRHHRNTIGVHDLILCTLVFRLSLSASAAAHRCSLSSSPQPPTFCIRFSFCDGRLSLASVVRTKIAGLSVSLR